MWSPGHWRQYEGGWFHEYEFKAARRYVRWPGVQEQLDVYPCWRGADWANASLGLVMGAMNMLFVRWDAPTLRPSFGEDATEAEVEEFLARPGMRELAFEIGFSGPLEQWDTVDMCLHLDVRLAWYQKVGLR